MDSEEFLAYLFMGVICLGLGLLVFILGGVIVDDLKSYGEYKEFCEEHKDTCACSRLECDFRLEYGTHTGPSEEVEEICRIARKYEDARILFMARCDG